MNVFDKFNIWRRKLRWNKQYKSGRWDSLKSDIETIRYKTIIDLIKQFGTNNPSILDLGSGEGILCEHMSSMMYSYFLGMDFSSVSIKNAQLLNLKNAEFVCADVHSFVTHKTFDVIIFNEVFYYIHLTEKENVLRRMFLQLNDGGIIICSMFRDHKNDWEFFNKPLKEIAFETIRTEEENRFWKIGVYKR